MQPRIAVVGSLNMDLVVKAARIPQPGETVLGAGGIAQIPGGKGANQCYGAARLGAHATMIGCVGADSFGDILVENLASVQVDTQHIRRDPASATGTAMIVVAEDGQNSIVVSSGANGQLSPADVDRAEAAIAAADVLLLQLETPLPTVTRAAQLARAHRTTVVLNPAPAQALPAELLALVDVLIPNETETALLSGEPMETDADLQSAATVLQGFGIGTLIITLGARGSMTVVGEETRHFPAFPITPVDTTAAGDAFVTGFGVALAEGQSLEAAVRFGNACGALAATRAGAQPSLPHRGEVEVLLKS